MNILIVRLMFAVTFLFFLIVSCFSQATVAKWERYEFWEEGISANFPKLPLVNDSSNICRHQARRTYYAYAEGAVYHVSVVRELKGDDSFCDETKKFNAKALEERKKELAKNTTFSDRNINGKSVSSFVGSVNATLVVDDLQNHRWLEVVVSSYDSTKLDSTDFAASVLTTSKGGGVYIGQGAKSMIGDPSEDEMKASQEKAIPVGKPRPSFTNKAREHNEKGTVRLKVEFRADGTIGKIEVSKALKYGLTEQAVAAAKRIAFVPGRYKGVPATTVRTIEYSFSIY